MHARNGTHSTTSKLRRILAAHDAAERSGIPVDEILDPTRVDTTLSRRRFLAGAAGAAAIAGLGFRPASAAAADGPRVAVIGAGLAGLRCAHWLWKNKGIAATIYEGSARAGGRCWSLRDKFPGYVVEHGGQFINSEHNAVRNLAAELGLALTDANGGNQPPGTDTFFIDGSEYPYDAANATWAQVRRAFRDALALAPYPTTNASRTPESTALDRMSVDEWLAANIPGGLGSKFAKLMQTNVITEYGLDPGDQSALNLIYLLAWNPKTSLDPINGGDEKYTVTGGNDQLITGMIDELPPGRLKMRHRLLAVRQGNSSVTCTFDNNGTVLDVTLDRVVLALPFTLLRDCDLSAAGLSSRKRRAIQEMALGTNGKLHLGMRRRPWVDLGRGGVANSDPAGHQCAWDETVGQPLNAGVLLDFSGGSATTDRWHGAAFATAPKADVNRFLGQIEPIFPGTTAAYTGVSWRDAWHLNPWTRGAYTCPRPGQYTELGGIAQEIENRVHFAGEHTSVEFFGYLNGAVESGKRAGQEVWQAIG